MAAKHVRNECERNRANLMKRRRKKKRRSDLVASKLHPFGWIHRHKSPWTIGWVVVGVINVQEEQYSRLSATNWLLLVSICSKTGQIKRASRSQTHSPNSLRLELNQRNPLWNDSTWITRVFHHLSKSTTSIGRWELPWPFYCTEWGSSSDNNLKHPLKQDLGQKDSLLYAIWLNWT